MKRPTRPLSPSATRAANAAVADMLKPPGRRIDPNNPADQPARQAWYEAYEKAGGSMEPASSSAKGAPVQTCTLQQRTNYIELKYLHCTGAPVAGAKYHITSPAFSQSGTLDGKGFVRIDGVPPIGGFDYWFDKDPELYKPKGPAVSTKGPPAEAAKSVLEEVGSWLWGTAQGDWNEEATTSQSVVNGILGVIPLVDQALDLRDLIANITHLVSYYSETEEQQKAHPGSWGVSYETKLWIDTFLCAIGCIPEAGSVIKGIAKVALKRAGDAGKSLSDLMPRQLQNAWAEALAVCNELASKQGNAHRWLQTASDLVKSNLAGTVNKVRAAINAVETVLRNARAFAEGAITRRIMADPDGVIARADKYLRILMRIHRRLEEVKTKVNDWIADQLRALFKGSFTSKSGGSINSPAAGGGNTTVQTRQPAPLTTAVDPHRRAMDIVEEGDFKAPPNRSVFYSGPGNREKALHAGNNGGMPIDNTRGGGALNGEGLYGDPPPMKQADADYHWSAASKKYANGAEGEVTAFVRGAKPDRVFGKTELPLLLDNQKVTTINGIPRTQLLQMEKARPGAAFDAVTAASPL